MGSEINVTKSFIDPTWIQTLLRLHRSQIQSAIDDIRKGLYDELLSKKSYSRNDVHLFARKFINNGCVYPLLYLDMHIWRDLDKDIVDAIYNYLSQIKQDLDAINSDIWLSSFREPRYRLSMVLSRWNRWEKQEYTTIQPDIYKYLPKELQEDIYKYLKLKDNAAKMQEKLNPYWFQYATICKILSRDII